MVGHGPIAHAFAVACAVGFLACLAAPSQANVPPLNPLAKQDTSRKGDGGDDAAAEIILGGPKSRMTVDQFLDRVMMIESGGRDDARNRRSTATGPYQFIASTFLYIMRRSYPERVAGKTRRQILAMRTNRKIARQAALALTQHNAEILVARGHDASFTNLRLAHLLGAGGASRVLAAKPNVRVARLLGRRVIRANPFMARLTAKQLVARAAREIAPPPDAITNAAAAVISVSGAAAGPVNTDGDAARDEATPRDGLSVAVPQAKARETAEADVDNTGDRLETVGAPPLSAARPTNRTPAAPPLQRASAPAISLKPVLVTAQAGASLVRTPSKLANKPLAHKPLADKPLADKPLAHKPLTTKIVSKAARAPETNRRVADAKLANASDTAVASDTDKPATSTAAIIKRAVSTEVIGKPPRAPLPAKRPKIGGPSDTITFDQFLDRLMIAESGGRDDARNPLSTATGPFQFIESTFLDVMRRHFPKVVEGKSRDEILALRTNRKIARDAARAFTEDNAAILAADGHTATFPNLRLAFLLGAGGASRVLAMEPNARVAPVLGRKVIRANPFMARLTAGQLVARAARDISVDAATLAGLKGDPSRLKRKKRAGPRIVVRCNLRLPSCKRWLALKKRRIRKGLDAKAKRLARQRRARNR